MLTSFLGLYSPLSHILTPRFLTLSLLPSDSDKSPVTSSSSSQPPPSKGAQDGSSREPSLRALATMSALSGTLGLAAVMAAQSASGYLFLLALLGPTSAGDYMTEFIRTDVSTLTPEQLSARAAMARSPRYAAFLVLFSIFSAALPEELLKYLPVAWLQRKLQRQQKKKKKLGKSAAVSAATAASLGFALVELAAYVQAAAPAAAAGAGPSMAVTLLERVFIGLPGHVAMAVLSAARGADADADVDDSAAPGWRDVVSAIAPSVLYHGLYDLALFGTSAWVGGHVGWVHPVGARAVVGMLGFVLSVQGVLYAHTLRAWLGWGDKSKKQ
ncbi:hypothetical protein N8I77_011357 [Diaporthe amygdali]|uniref:Uncharacterized protein n=1 Tax=Phomopsis amygdali TaxID=1214568 RepID=A0AAD9S587_PHOAM|nr:hypothetical protein N8I77_011357 [Diaporthe amygdali]